MKVAIVDVAIAHFLARLVLILTTASEIYIVMSSGGLFDSIDGDPRDIGQLWCCVFFGLAILVLSVIAWRAPAFEVPLDTGPYGARYGGSWLSRRRKMVLNRVFIQDPSSPVPTRYWRACGGVLFLDTLCLILWIVAITLAFPWNKERFLALLRGEPVGESLLFTTIFMVTCIVLIWPYAWRWRDGRNPQVVLPPKWRRARPITAASAEKESSSRICISGSSLSSTIVSNLSPTSSFTLSPLSEASVDVYW